MKIIDVLGLEWDDPRLFVELMILPLQKILPQAEITGLNTMFMLRFLQPFEIRNLSLAFMK